VVPSVTATAANHLQAAPNRAAYGGAINTVPDGGTY
jgi:hypothetical protein